MLPSIQEIGILTAREFPNFTMLPILVKKTFCGGFYISFFFSFKGPADVMRDFVNDQSIMAAPSLIVLCPIFKSLQRKLFQSVCCFFLRADFFFTIVHA